MAAQDVTRTGRARAKPAPGAALVTTGVAVDEEQRRRLIECCAFFRAARFRPEHPGGYRKQDRQAAQADVDAIIGRHKPKSC